MDSNTEHEPVPPYEAISNAAPAYEARSHDDVSDDAIVEPTIFILAGQFIHVETADAPAAYELNRGVATLTKSTEKVEFTRVDQTISASSSSSGAPIVKNRRRNLYTLRRTVEPPRIGFSRSRSGTDAPEYYIHSMSARRTLGHVGLANARHGGFAAGFTAVPVSVAAATGQVRFAARGPPLLFALRRTRDRSRWVAGPDGDETVAIEDAADEQQRLILIKAMPRKEVDALVALWCCRIWQDAAARAAEASREVGGSSFTRKMDRGRGVYLGTKINY